MSITWSEIQSKWLQDYQQGYLRETIELAFNTIIRKWGREYLDGYKVQTVWNVAHLIDLGHIIHKLEKTQDSEELIDRLKKGEPAAYSEAKLAEHFIDQGLEMTLQPTVNESGRRNDIAVKIGSEWANVEVKTPMESDLKREVQRDLNEILQLVDIIPVSREIHIGLTRIPTAEERQVIISFTQKLAQREEQPANGVVGETEPPPGAMKEVAWIRTDTFSVETEIEDDKRRRIFIFNFLKPKMLEKIRENTPILSYTVVHLGGKPEDPDVYLELSVPFDDHRLIGLIEKKRRQLSRETYNMVALDITRIPLGGISRHSYDWVKRLREALKTKLSRRIGAVLLFSTLTFEGRVITESTLYEHQNPYRPLPSLFLEKCDLTDQDFKEKLSQYAEPNNQ